MQKCEQEVPPPLSLFTGTFTPFPYSSPSSPFPSTLHAIAVANPPFFPRSEVKPPNEDKKKERKNLRKKSHHTSALKVHLCHVWQVFLNQRTRTQSALKHAGVEGSFPFQDQNSLRYVSLFFFMLDPSFLGSAFHLSPSPPSDAP